MAKRRFRMSLADYVVIAITPGLIMLLVGSLSFFLLGAFYKGGFAERLHWVLFWFVFATVLISRISIELGKDTANAYGLTLGAATTLVMFRLSDTPWAAIVILGVIWWCSNKLVYDCTLIDDSQDASGEGLLALSGLEEKTGTSDVPPAVPVKATKSPPKKEEQIPRWKKQLGRKNVDKKNTPHAPGVSIVYFSLAALPMFGLGQLLIPAEDTAERSAAFRSLIAYVFAAMGLLLMTSFLGLRRYLRQRKLVMPASMTGMWIGTGGTMAVVILVVCLLLPRPNAEYSLTAMLDKAAENNKDGSEYAMTKSDPTNKDGKRIGEANEDQEAGERGEGDQDEKDVGNKNAPKGDGKAQGKDEKNENDQQGGQGTKQKNGKDEQGGDGKDGEKKGSSKDGKKGDDKGQGKDENEDKDGKGSQPKKGNEQNGNQSNTQKAKSPLSQAPTWILKLVKWIIYALIGVVVAVFVLKNWQSLINSFLQIIQDILNFFRGLFGRPPKKRRVKEKETPATLPPPRPFAAYQNPFLTGSEMSPAELVRYTFEAVSAWALEQGVPWKSEQTPIEFANQMRDEFYRRDAGEEFPRDLKKTASWYARMAYANRNPSRDCEDVLQRVWEGLEHDLPPVSKMHMGSY